MVDFNDLLSYKTAKFVSIRDWRLGAMQKGLMFLIFVKIIILQVCIKNLHLLQKPVFGSSRLKLTQPTVNNCDPLDVTCKSDFKPMSLLPYCEQYGTGKDNIPDRFKEFASDDAASAKVANCEFWDSVEMTRGRTPVPGTMFIPTRVTKYVQKPGCQPDEDNGFSCDTKPFVHDLEAEKKFKPHSFMGDVERFTILFSQTFVVEGADLHHDTHLHSYLKGYPGESHQHLKDRVRPEGRVARQDADGLVHEQQISNGTYHDPVEFTTARHVREGDVLTLADLFLLADDRGVALLDAEREDGTTMRWMGTVLEVTFEYSNKKMGDALGQEPPRYVITAKFLPMDDYNIMYARADHETGGRFMDDVHGILILCKVRGNIGVLSMSAFLTMLTTAMVSLALAATLTDAVMMYGLSMAPKYTILKYQPSMNFGMFRQVIDDLKKKMGSAYKPTDHKAMPHADILNDLAEKKLAPKDLELLLILCKFEQRLNRVDGMDHLNAVGSKEDPDDMDTGLKFVMDFEEKYLSARKEGNDTEMALLNGGNR